MAEFRDLRYQMAACLERARKASKKDVWDSTNEIYWHTREACAEIARKSGFHWHEVVLHDADRPWRWAGSEAINLASEPLWSRVMHPDLLLQDVMES